MLESEGEETSQQDVEAWLDLDEGDPGHHMLSEQEIVDSVLNVDSDDNEGTTRFSLKLSQAREYLDQLIQMVDLRSSDFKIGDYENLCSI